MSASKTQIKSAKDILLNHDFLNRIQHANKYISSEYQDYGIRLASKLNDLQHKALYIKLCKEMPRGIIESASQFALDYPTDSKGKIFMWKLNLIAKEKGIKVSGGFKKKKIVKEPTERKEVKRKSKISENQFQLI